MAGLVATDSCSDNPSIIPCHPSLFIVRFVMTRCMALEFCSQAATFLGNRRLLVTTVHIRAYAGWQDKDVTKTSPLDFLSASAIANRNMRMNFK